MVEVEALVDVGVDIIALDATSSLRPGGKTLSQFYKEIRQKFPHQKLMADCSTLEEMLIADKLGFDFIGTTLVGYTKQSKHLKIEAHDFEIIKKAVSILRHPIIAEGNISTPEKAKRVMELGVYCIVVGSAITRPQLITKTFADAILENRSE